MTEALLAKLSKQAAEAAAEVHRAVEQIRGSVADLQHEIARLEHGAVSRPEAEARLRALVEYAGRDVAADLRGLVAIDQAPPAPGLTPGGMLGREPAMALLAAVQPEALLAWGMAVLDRYAADRGGWAVLSTGERQEEIARLKAELLEIERGEERLIVQAEAAGLIIQRRENADPRAVLELPD